MTPEERSERARRAAEARWARVRAKKEAEVERAKRSERARRAAEARWARVRAESEPPKPPKPPKPQKTQKKAAPKPPKPAKRQTTKTSTPSSRSSSRSVPQTQKRSTEGVYSTGRSTSEVARQAAITRWERYWKEHPDEKAKHDAKKKRRTKGTLPRPIVSERSSDYDQVLDRIDKRISKQPKAVRPIWNDIQRMTTQDAIKEAKPLVTRANRVISDLIAYEAKTGITPPRLKDLRKEFGGNGKLYISKKDTLADIAHKWGKAASILNDPKYRAEYVRANNQRLKDFTGVTDPKLQTKMIQAAEKLQSYTLSRQYDSAQIRETIQEMINAMPLSPDDELIIDENSIDNAFETVRRMYSSWDDIMDDDYWD